MKAIETSRYLEAWKFLLSSSFLVKRELVCADVFSINGFPQFPKLLTVLILQFAWNFDRKKRKSHKWKSINSTEMYFVYF